MSLTISAFADLSLWTLVGLAVSAFLCATFHAVGGFGGVLLLSVCIAPIIGVKEAIPVVTVAGMLSNVTRLTLFRKQASFRSAFIVLAAATPGVIATAWLYSAMDTRIVALVLGVFLIISLPLRRMLAKREIKVGHAGLASAGVVFGLLGGLVVGAGLILIPFLLGAGIIGEALVGTVAMIGFGLNLTKALVFGGTTLLTPSWVTVGFAMGLISIPGVWLGRWILRNTPLRVHTLFIEGLILAGALYFLWQARG